MAQISNETVLLIGVLIAVVIFVMMGCKVKCAKKNVEGYIRTQLAQGQGGRMHRSPADFVNTWKANPHYTTNPSNKFQPLVMGGLDLEAELRKLAAGKLFEEFSQNWGGPSGGKMWVSNEEKVRDDLVNLGDVQASLALNDQVTPGMHPQGTGMSFDNLRLRQRQNMLQGANRTMASVIRADLVRN